MGRGGWMDGWMDKCSETGQFDNLWTRKNRGGLCIQVRISYPRVIWNMKESSRYREMVSVNRWSLSLLSVDVNKYGI